MQEGKSVTRSINAAMWELPAGGGDPDQPAVSSADRPTTSSIPKSASSIAVDARDASNAITINLSDKITEESPANDVVWREVAVPHSGRARQWRLIAATGVAVLVVAGAVLYWMHGTQRLTTAAVTRPQEKIIARPETNAPTQSNAQAFDPKNLPPPDSTIRRMDAISKSFSKK